ncbi:MAG: hypothetical protein LBO04_04715 [Spirochaetaceae bacterium]|jgi:uncharacterized protein (DUF697 family)|nr:hypothetical protein [Spirochaetaceae bacterium]
MDGDREAYAAGPDTDIASYISGSVVDPVPLSLGINLSGAGWGNLLSAIQAADINMALDLYACAMTGKESIGWNSPQRQGQVR